MKSKKIKNKEGEVLKNKDGQDLIEHKLEPGDEFIPDYNSILERTNEVEIEGKKKKIINYSIKCKVREKDGTTHENIYVTLTPAQAESLKKKKEAGIELNQTLFITYEYEHENFGTCIGVGIKTERKPAKTFEDFEKE